MAGAVALAVLAWTAMAGPIGARSVEGVKRELKKIEDQLRAGDWSAARSACDRSLYDLIRDYARGSGTRPIYGLLFGFRAIAEAGLGDIAGAVWDWTAAAQLSPEATGFDLAHFGTPGVELRDVLANEPEAVDLRDPIQQHGERVLPAVPMSAMRQESDLDCRVVLALHFTDEGRPARVHRIESSCFDSATALVAETIETYRGWRFEPATQYGQAVDFHSELTSRFQIHKKP